MPTVNHAPYWLEACANDRTPRPHWRGLWPWLQQTDHAQLRSSAHEVHRLLREQEITYTVHGADTEEERLWDLDCIPLCLDPAEWQQISRGLRQRYRVMEALIADLHGPRSVISHGLVPPRLLFEHPQYQRALHGFQPMGGWLQCYAADLVRGMDGRWRVLADRCQSPHGLGYALQNRFVIARCLPDLFREARVHRMADTLQALRLGLAGLSAQADPRIVVLASEAYGDNNFEQAFLCRYLGFELVHGHDLTVREDRVLLKTLAGLQQVDVILRFVDDAWCDPLYGRGDSTQGVPGLLRAVRAGTVAVANAIGSGLGDCPALRPLITPLCRHFLQEDALLQSLPARWAGDPASAEELARQPQDWVFLSTWYCARRQPLDPRQMGQRQLQQLQRQLRERGETLTAVPHLDCSQAPVWEDDALHQRGIALRAFVIRSGDTLHVLPGGLVRSAATADELHAGIRHGGGSKDAWLIGSQDSPPPPLPRMPDIQDLRRDGIDPPSSLLDDIFWFGRGVERIEALARQLRLILGVHGDLVLGDRNAWPTPLTSLLTSLQLTTDARPEVWQNAFRHCLAAKQPTALRTHTEHLLGLARRTRNVLSPDTWSLVRSLHAHSARPPSSSHLATLHAALDRVIMLCGALAGSFNENTVRNAAWRFLELGRRLERALQSAQVTIAFLQDAAAEEHLDLLLSLADSGMTYRARYRSVVQRTPVLDLLLCDESNPRAIAFQLASIRRILAALPEPPRGYDPDLNEALEYCHPPAHDQVETWLSHIPEALLRLAEAIDHTWFSHAVAASQVDRSQLVRELP